MAKLAVLAALFIALIAGASAHTTRVSTTVVEEENPSRQSCQREIQQKQPMTQCRQWMQKGSPFLRSAVANPERYEEEQLQECCDELRMFSPQCRCQALRKMMETMQQHYGMEGEEMMSEKVMSLPRRCHMTSPSHCYPRGPVY